MEHYVWGNDRYLRNTVFNLSSSSPKNILLDREVAQMATPAAPQILPIETRRSILQRDIADYVSRGFLVISQTDTTAQLRRPKTFSLLWSVFWLIFGLGIGFIIYLLYYAAKKDETVYIEVGRTGNKNYQTDQSISPIMWVVIGVAILLAGCAACTILGLVFNAISLPTTG